LIATDGKYINKSYILLFLNTVLGWISIVLKRICPKTLIIMINFCSKRQ